MDRLLQLEVFSKVAELNSLSRAADALGHVDPCGEPAPSVH
jgi:DNA-binding transcriptional LysR family regulator